jgi:hypothetical protein
MKHFAAAAGMALAMSAASNDARAGFDDGNSLERLCSSSNVVEAGVCAGYVAGALDMKEAVDILLNGASRAYCLPQNATIGQLTAVIRKWMYNNPERLHQSAASIVGVAMINAYPCAPPVATAPSTPPSGKNKK